MTTILKQTGVRTIRVPRLIMENGALKTLSGDALALFLAISFRCYRTRSPEVKFKFKELFQDLNQRAQVASDAALELRAAKLIHFQQEKNVLTFQIQEPNGSKAKRYLREQPEQDANFA